MATNKQHQAVYDVVTVYFFFALFVFSFTIAATTTFYYTLPQYTYSVLVKKGGLKRAECASWGPLTCFEIVK